MKTFEELQQRLKTLSPEERRQFIINLCIICDRDFGNSEVDPSDVLDPNEMSQMFLIDCSIAQMNEAFYLLSQSRKKKIDKSYI